MSISVGPAGGRETFAENVSDCWREVPWAAGGVGAAERRGAAGGERARARESGGAARLLLGAVLGSCGSGGERGGQRRPSLDGTRVNDLSPIEFLNYDFDAVMNTHKVPYIAPSHCWKCPLAFSHFKNLLWYDTLEVTPSSSARICPHQILCFLHSIDVKIEELYSPLTLIYLLIIYLDTLYLWD